MEYSIETFSTTIEYYNTSDAIVKAQLGQSKSPPGVVHPSHNHPRSPSRLFPQSQLETTSDLWSESYSPSQLLYRPSGPSSKDSYFSFFGPSVCSKRESRPRERDPPAWEGLHENKERIGMTLVNA